MNRKLQSYCSPGAVLVQSSCSTFAVSMQYDCSRSSVFSLATVRMAVGMSIYWTVGNRDRSTRVEYGCASCRAVSNGARLGCDGSVTRCLAPAVRSGLNAPGLSPSLRFEAFEPAKNCARNQCWRGFQRIGTTRFTCSNDARWRRLLAH